MDKVSTLILHNLKKSGGQYISFALIICLTAFVMNIALVLAFQTFDAYDRRFSELETADVNFMIPRSAADGGELLNELRGIDSVSEAEKHNGIFVTAKEVEL